jgi:hypothetical protein
MTSMFAANPNYLEYEDLLKELHRLIAEGKGDSDEADNVREIMEWPERKLTREELDRLEGLSADLYMLQDNEVFEPLEPGEDPAERTPDRLMQRLRDAWAQADAETSLAVMRLGPLPLAQAQIAYLRAEAYEQLGHPDTALLFANYAVQLAPQNEIYKLRALRLLSASGRPTEVDAPAGEYATPV